MGLDIGPQAMKFSRKAVSNSRQYFGTDPMGVFEMEKFAGGTKAIAQAVVDATGKGAFSLIGGGILPLPLLNLVQRKSKLRFDGGGARLSTLKVRNYGAKALG
jgi:phosphoglycerate kinase